MGVETTNPMVPLVETLSPQTELGTLGGFAQTGQGQLLKGEAVAVSRLHCEPEQVEVEDQQRLSQVELVLVVHDKDLVG